MFGCLCLCLWGWLVVSYGVRSWFYRNLDSVVLWLSGLVGE